MKKVMVKCSVCERIFTGIIPKGGDGSAYFPHKHKVAYVIKPHRGSSKIVTLQRRVVCEGSYREAEIAYETN